MARPLARPPARPPPPPPRHPPPCVTASRLPPRRPTTQVHNIPEGICVAMPIYYATGNRWRAFGWSLLSGITEPIGGILGFAALQPVFTELVFGIIFSMVGGMMVFIVCHELLPAAHRYMNNTVKTTAWLVTGMFIMATSLVMFVQ